MLTSYNTQGPTEVFPGFVIVPTGGMIHYVHHSGAAALSNLPPGMYSPSPGGFFTSVNAALNVCRSNRGDRIVCLPGHAENIDAADKWSNIKAGVEVIGTGTGDNRATFTWTAATSTILMDVASFAIRNCNLYLAGPHAAGTALTVAAPITVSAAGCSITDCRVFFGFAANQNVTIGITTTAAGDDFSFRRNYCRAEVAAATGTTFMQLVGADYMTMEDCFISGASSGVNVGIVRFLTTASLGINWRRNVIQNQLASSVSAVTGLAGCTGQVHQCGWGILDNATLAGFTTPANIQFYDCYTVNNNGENGAAMTPVSV